MDRCIVGVDELAPGKWKVSFSDMATEVIGEGPKMCTQELPLSQPYLLRTLPILRVKGLALSMWVFQGVLRASMNERRLAFMLEVTRDTNITDVK